MTLNSVIIGQIFGLPLKDSLRELGFDFFIEMANAFHVKFDEDSKIRDVATDVLQSYPAKALFQSFFYCFERVDLTYRCLHTEELYILCFLLGLGQQKNKIIAAENLLIRLNEIRSGASIEIHPLPNNLLLKQLNKRYYGKQKIQPKRGQSKLLIA